MMLEILHFPVNLENSAFMICFQAQDAEQRVMVAEAEKTSSGQSEAVPESGSVVEKKPSTAGGAETNKEEGQAELRPRPRSLDPTQLPPLSRVSEFSPLLPHFIYQQQVSQNVPLQHRNSPPQNI